MKKILLFIFLIAGTYSFLHGQTVPMGINYQAIARDAAGQAQKDVPVFLRISLTSADEEAEVFYLEEHQVRTDQLGLFNLIIGQGQPVLGRINFVPWAEEDIWMNVEMAADASKNYQLVSSSQLLAVPYAMHVETTDRIAEPSEEDLELRNQSIYWATSGNKNATDSINFVGTRGAEDFVIKTDSTTRAIFTKEGQLQIYSGVGANGADNNPDDYPMTVEGSKQGIWITVDTSRTSANNFVTFTDTEVYPNQVWGRIEGQTWDELTSSTAYQVQVACFALTGTSLIAQIIAKGVEAAGEGASIFGIGAAFFSISAGISIGIQSAALITNAVSWRVFQEQNVGVSYSSGNGDYAEWLERIEGTRDLLPGEVVGLHAGKVSLNTSGTYQVMVVSNTPIVLGNMPKQSKEALYEKIAFMGQVPVRIAGPANIGDFIIPSGNNDGLGVAIAPADLELGDYAKIVGIVWESAEDRPINIVNAAVGINSNDLAKKAYQLDQRVENVMDFLEGKAPLVTDANAFTMPGEGDLPTTSFEKVFSDENFDQFVEENSAFINNFFQAAKVEMQKQGTYDVSNPELQKFYNDPIEYIKVLRKDPAYQTQWSMMDEKVMNILKGN